MQWQHHHDDNVHQKENWIGSIHDPFCHLCKAKRKPASDKFYRNQSIKEYIFLIKSRIQFILFTKNKINCNNFVEFLASYFFIHVVSRSFSFHPFFAAEFCPGQWHQAFTGEQCKVHSIVFLLSLPRCKRMRAAFKKTLSSSLLAGIVPSDKSSYPEILWTKKSTLQFMFFCWLAVTFVLQNW